MEKKELTLLAIPLGVVVLFAGYVLMTRKPASPETPSRSTATASESTPNTVSAQQAPKETAPAMVEEPNKAVAPVKVAKGKLSVEVTYLFNNHVGNKPDTGAVILLIPKGYNKKLQLEIVGLQFLKDKEALEKEGLQFAIVSGTGKAKFNKVPVGEYICVMQSNKVNNYGMDDLTKAMVKEMEAYFTGDLFTLCRHKRYHVQKIEIEEGDETEISHDFWMTGL